MTTDEITDRVMQVLREEIRPGALDRKALRKKIRRIAVECGVAPPPDPRQVAMFPEVSHG